MQFCATPNLNNSLWGVTKLASSTESYKHHIEAKSVSLQQRSVLGLVKLSEDWLWELTEHLFKHMKLFLYEFNDYRSN